MAAPVDDLDDVPWLSEPQPDPDAARIDAQADIATLKALAATLDAKIARDGLNVSGRDLRLRMDYARTLSVLRDRLRRLPEPKPVWSLADRVTARWQADRAARAAAAAETPAPPAPATSVEDF